MKFRSLLYIIIALASFGLSVMLAKPYGGYGCAFATSLALLLGQVIIMNVYYQYKQHIDIIMFWKEIAKMSCVPLLFIIIGLFVINSSLLGMISYVKFIAFGLFFSIVYGIAFWTFSMNKDERNLIMSPLVKLKKRITKSY